MRRQRVPGGGGRAEPVVLVAGLRQQPRPRSREAVRPRDVRPRRSRAEPVGRHAVPVADPEHAVDPPGPFEGAAGPRRHADRRPDEPLERRAWSGRIKRLKGVAAASASSASAGADREPRLQRRGRRPGDVPPVHRGPQRTSSRTQWDRVAGGELAIDAGLQKRLPIDDEGYLRSGSGEERPAGARRRLRPAGADASTWWSTRSGARSSGSTSPATRC